MVLRGSQGCDGGGVAVAAVALPLYDLVAQIQFMHVFQILYVYAGKFLYIACKVNPFDSHFIRMDLYMHSKIQYDHNNQYRRGSNNKQQFKIKLRARRM